MLLAAVAVVVLRRPSAVVHPELWAEDGRVWFGSAYNGGWWSTLWQPYSGYLQVFPRLVADVALGLSLRAVPVLFAWVAVVVQALPAVVVASDRMAEAVPRRGVRLVLAALYLAVPNAGEVGTNITNAQWHLALLAILCLLAHPGGRAWRVFDVVVVVLSGLTGPFGIVLVAVGAWWVRRGATRSRWRTILWSIALVLALVQATIVVASHRDSGLAALGASVSRLLVIIGGQVGIGSVAGSHAVLVLERTGHDLALFAVMAAVVVIAWGVAATKGPPALRFFVLCAVGILAGSLASPVASTTVPQWQALGTDAGGRYWMFPILAFLACATWMASHVVVGLRAVLPVRHPPRRRPALSRAASAVPAVSFGLMGATVLALSGGWAVPADFAQSPTVAVGYGIGVTRFLDAPPGAVVDIPTDPPGWVMILGKR